MRTEEASWINNHKKPYVHSVCRNAGDDMNIDNRDPIRGTDRYSSTGLDGNC